MGLVDLRPFVGLAVMLRTANSLAKRKTKRGRPWVDAGTKHRGLLARRTRWSGGSGHGQTQAIPRTPALRADLSGDRTASGELREADSQIPARTQSSPPRHARSGCAWTRRSRKRPGCGRTKSLWKTSPLSHCLRDWGSCVRLQDAPKTETLRREGRRKPGTLNAGPPPTGGTARSARLLFRGPALPLLALEPLSLEDHVRGSVSFPSPSVPPDSSEAIFRAAFLHPKKPRCFCLWSFRPFPCHSCPPRP
ncbi:uncharacterized protein LOC104861499 [Fukomys damarensis]|uniref:uncharacterized protein LOC104861499 n=1 Tax=Fukomys damarensis TaxID=885580 RepID=UPI00145512C4|nr:uncharacterized protein LOC104861499 [Fukomys damarensis]